MHLVEVSYHFRAANSSDVEIFYDSHLEYTNSFLRIGEFAAIFDAKLNDKNLQFFILATGDTKKTMGCVVLRYYQEVFDEEVIAEIAHLYIAPKHRKHQAADMLYDFIESSCLAEKITKISVACGINSTLNQRFYTRRKFNYIKKMFFKHIHA